MHIDRIRAAPLIADPFDHIFVENAVDPESLPALVRDFPQVPAGGSFDVRSLAFGPSFGGLIAAIESPTLRTAIAEKFAVDLDEKPLHITVRGQVRGKDGRIHNDSRDKILTGLLYLNPEWNEPGGRLRLLRNAHDIENYAFEVPPLAGNLLVFRRCETSWHGHLPSKGRRLSLQFNWVSGDAYARRERARHRVSGWLKRLTGAPVPA